MPTVSMVKAKAGIQIFDAEAHRGGRDARPENTLFAFAYALELGVTTLEMDMQMTKDGRIVISHDPFMNPSLAKGPDGRYVKAGKHDIRTMTLAEIRQFDLGEMNPAAGDYYEDHGKTQLACPGAKMPTLEEVFALARDYGDDKVLFNLETKTYPDPTLPAAKNSPDPAVFVNKAYKIIKKYRLEERVMLQSFDWRTLQVMKKLDPAITLIALACDQTARGCGRLRGRPGASGASPWLAGLDIDTFKGNYVPAAKAAGADAVSPYWEELSHKLVCEAHALGMKVVPWTVNQRDKMSMLIDMGVDGLITDKPWLLRELLLHRGMAVAAPTVNAGSPYHTGTGLAAGAAK